VTLALLAEPVPGRVLGGCLLCKQHRVAAVSSTSEKTTVAQGQKSMVVKVHHPGDFSEAEGEARSQVWLKAAYLQLLTRAIGVDAGSGSASTSLLCRLGIWVPALSLIL
jgi:hypothetical protein